MVSGNFREKGLEVGDLILKIEDQDLRLLPSLEEVEHEFCERLNDGATLYLGLSREIVFEPRVPGAEGPAGRAASGAGADFSDLLGAADSGCDEHAGARADDAALVAPLRPTPPPTPPGDWDGDRSFRGPVLEYLLDPDDAPDAKL